MSPIRTTMMAGAAALVAASGVALAQPGPGPQGGPPPGGGPGFGAPGMMGRGAGGPESGPGTMHRHHHGRGGPGGFMLGEAFGRADANGDGKVTREEGLVWLQARFNEVDANRDGGVTFEELRAYSERMRGEFGMPVRGQGPGQGQGPGAGPMAEQMRQAMEQRGMMMFRFVDANGDGRITFEELRPAAEAMFRAADRNGDGALSRAEVVPPRGPGRMGQAPVAGQPAAPPPAAPPAAPAR